MNASMSLTRWGVFPVYVFQNCAAISLGSFDVRAAAEEDEDLEDAEAGLGVGVPVEEVEEEVCGCCGCWCWDFGVGVEDVEEELDTAERLGGIIVFFC